MSDTEEKKHDPTSSKLRKQREEGNVASSQDTIGLFSTAGGIIALFVSAWMIWFEIPTLFRFDFTDVRDDFSGVMRSEIQVVGRMVLEVLAPVAGVILAIVILTTLLLNNGIVFSTKPVAPKVERVGMVAGFKRLFGMRGWLEVGTGTLRLFVWLAYLTIVGLVWLPKIVYSSQCGLHCQKFVFLQALFYTLIGAVFLIIIVAFIEAILQKQIYFSEQRMTDSEIKKERKDQAGSPEVRAERSRLRRELAGGGGEGELPKTTTVAFTGLRGIVGINYNPPNQQLPLVSATAPAGPEALILKSQLQSQGIPFVNNNIIVEDCIERQVGEMLSQECFKDFARALTILQKR